jgi:hypothetical protein
VVANASRAGSDSSRGAAGSEAAALQASLLLQRGPKQPLSGNILQPHAHRDARRVPILSPHKEPRMTKITILRKDGTASPYFWMDADKKAPAEKTVYKQTPEGIKRMTGVHFDSTKNRIVKH